MKLYVKLVFNKLVANLLIYLVPKFHDIWMSSLRVVIVTRSCCEVLALWIFQDSKQTLPISTYFRWESVDTVFGHVSLGTRLEIMRCRSAGGGVVTSLQESCR